ncbi:MAG: BatA domain-containing protein [Planctomycetes bacterium]|nr:BatA domain-containing protein [Planctomycetota bacterium]
MSWFTQPWGLLGLLAIPAVIALHLFRRRYQEHAVAALFLWEDAQRAESAGRKRQPLRRTPSFWLEVLAALLAALLLAGFDPLTGSEAKHLVAVLDDTASMGHAPRREAVLKALEKEFDTHGRRTRVTLVRTGARPSLICGPAALIPDARAALANWNPSAPNHTPSSAIDLARELASDSEILYLTDQGRDLEPSIAQDVRIIGVGVPTANLAIADARRIKKNGRETLRVLVRSFSDQTESTTLRISVDGVELANRLIELNANEEQSLSIPLPAKSPTLQLAIDDDALIVDNLATLHPPMDRRVRIAHVLDEKDADSLRVDDLIASLPDVTPSAIPTDAHLVLSHAPAMAPAWSLVLPRNPSQGDEAEAYVRGFVPDLAHPLLRDLTFEGIVWTRANAFTLPGAPLVSVGEYALLTESLIEGGAVYHLNLIASRSTLALSPDWPILLSNLVGLRRASLPGPRAVNLVAGEYIELRRSGRHRYRLTGSSIEGRALFAEDLLRIENLPPAPDYTLTTEEEEGSQSWVFAVNFRDVRESDLRRATSKQTPPYLKAKELSSDRYAESPASRILLLLLLSSIAGDWWILRRSRHT